MTCCDGNTCGCGKHGIHVDIISGDFKDEEVALYVKRAEDMVKRGELPEDLCRISLEDVGDGEVKIGYYKDQDIPIERIRRITGYLVGTLSRFNDAKKAEEHDRVKHLTKESYLKDNCPNKPCDACTFQESCDKK